MGFKHACSFCGWERFSSTPVMLAPECGRCGCALDARVAEAACAPVALGVLPPRWMLALRVAGVVFAMLALYAATKVGYDLAGGSGGLIAFGIGAFLLVPFVPQRLGAPRAAATDA
jgi:hypothetical protein